MLKDIYSGDKDSNPTEFIEYEGNLIFQAELANGKELWRTNGTEAGTYMIKDIWKYIDSLPGWLGSAIILDDNSERIYTVQVRPRYSWHAGESAIAITS